MNQQDDWQWSQYDHHDAIEWKLTDIEQAALISTQQAINGRLDMTFDELITSMTASSKEISNG